MDYYEKSIELLKEQEQMLIRQSKSLKKQYIFLSVLLWAAGLYVVAMTFMVIGKLFF